MIEHTIFYPFILSLPVTKANPRSYHFLNVHLSLFSTFYFCLSTSFLSFYTPPLHFFFYLPSSLSSTVRSSVRPLVPSRFQFFILLISLPSFLTELSSLNFFLTFFHSLFTYLYLCLFITVRFLPMMNLSSGPTMSSSFVWILASSSIYIPP